MKGTAAAVKETFAVRHVYITDPAVADTVFQLNACIPTVCAGDAEVVKASPKASECTSKTNPGKGTFRVARAMECDSCSFGSGSCINQQKFCRTYLADGSCPDSFEDCNPTTTSTTTSNDRRRRQVYMCEKQGDAGQWTCPGTDTMINCEYVCDDYEPADCDNGADEDADFCAVWNGATGGNSFIWTTTATTTSTTSTTTTTTTTVTSTTTSASTTTTTRSYDPENVDCVESQDACTAECETSDQRNYQVEVPAVKNGRACVNATDCVPGEDKCPSTTITSTTSTLTTSTLTTTTSTTTTATTTTMTTTTKLLELNDRCNPNYDRCRKCSDPVDSPAFNDTCNRDDDLVCDRERNNECRYITDLKQPLVADEPYDWLSVLRTLLPVLSVAIAAGVLAYKLRNAEDKKQACLQFFRCVDKEASSRMDDDIVDRLEDIVKTATLGSSGGKDSSLAVPRAVTLEKYRRRLSMYQLNDGVLGADEMDALKDEFGKEGITVIEHDTLLAEIISKENFSSSSDAENDSDADVDAAVTSASDDDEMAF